MNRLIFVNLANDFNAVKTDKKIMTDKLPSTERGGTLSRKETTLLVC